MKYAIYQIEATTVEYHNSLLGKEARCVNGRITAEKHFFWGTEHFFKIVENNYSILNYIAFKLSSQIAGSAFGYYATKLFL